MIEEIIGVREHLSTEPLRTMNTASFCRRCSFVWAVERICDLLYEIYRPMPHNIRLLFHILYDSFEESAR